MNAKNIPSALKVLNRKIVYNIVSREDGISRADIARRTGISGATVLKIAEYLSSRGIIGYDSTESPALPGRKPAPIRFNAGFAYIIAIYMEGLYASMGILNASGQVVSSKQYRIPDTARFIRKNLYHQIDSLIASSGIENEKIIGIGMAVPAALDSKTLKVYRAPLSYASWLSNFGTIVSELSSRYGVPVFVENDVNAAAYGEYRSVYGGSGGSLVYLSLGSGLGGGIILNGKIWKGQNASAGELGFLILDSVGNWMNDTEKLPVNTGWLENKTGFAALEKKFGFSIKTTHNEERIIRYLSEYLALAVFNINTVLDISTVVLGGVLSDRFEDSLVRGIRKELERKSPYAPLVVPGKVKNPSFAGLGYIIMDELLDEILGS